jgi:hypothetical protein
MGRRWQPGGGRRAHCLRQQATRAGRTGACTRTRTQRGQTKRCACALAFGRWCSEVAAACDIQELERVQAERGQADGGGQPERLLHRQDIELHADGSIKNIDVMRRPSQAHDTTQMAIDAVKRAAPFGDVSKLPKPWRFAEAFLFNDDRRFKPRTLDAQ